MGAWADCSTLDRRVAAILVLCSAPSVSQSVFTITEKALTRALNVLNVKALVGAFNQEKALVGAFSVIVKSGCGTDGSICGTSFLVSAAQVGCSKHVYTKCPRITVK